MERITNITKITWAIKHALSVDEKSTRERVYTMAAKLTFYGGVKRLNRCFGLKEHLLNKSATDIFVNIKSP